ncbi:hypothetical protein BHM03_00027860 [Ensete ventricosum]|nr:hypothetical protein BHM03_00027860 [Ensete ventricosum]
MESVSTFVNRQRPTPTDATNFHELALATAWGFHGDEVPTVGYKAERGAAPARTSPTSQPQESPINRRIDEGRKEDAKEFDPELGTGGTPGDRQQTEYIIRSSSMAVVAVASNSCRDFRHDDLPHLPGVDNTTNVTVPSSHTTDKFTCYIYSCGLTPYLLSEHCWFRPLCVSSSAIVSVRSRSSARWMDPPCPTPEVGCWSGGVRVGWRRLSSGRTPAPARRSGRVGSRHDPSDSQVRAVVDFSIPLSRRGAGVFIASVIGPSYLRALLPLRLTMSSYPSTIPLVLAVRCASAGKECRPYLCQLLACGSVGLVPSGSSGIGCTERSSGIDPIEQELGNSIGARTNPTEWELGNLNGAGANPTERGGLGT